MLLFQFILIQTIVFGIVLYILKKLMWGNTESAVNRLNQSYLEINKKKEDLSSKIQQIEKEYQKRKAEAEAIASEVKEKADVEVYEKRERIIKNAKEESERIITEAMSMKDVIRADIRKEEQLRLLDFCENLLSMTLKDVVKTKINKVLIDDFMEEFKSIDMGQVPEVVTEVEIVSVEELSPEITKTISDGINKSLKRNLTVKPTIDKNIVGGIVLKFGSLLLDGSLSGKLNEKVQEKKQRIEENA